PQLICATPTFILSRIWPDAPADMLQAAAAIEHAPWLVANLSLSRMPEERRGAQLSWDNVIYQSPGLGYVVATHQQIRTRPGPTVLTYYRAFGGADTKQSRQQLLATPRETWTETILAEMERIHPNIRQITTNVNITRYGHAMAKPTTGSLWHGKRALLSRPVGRIQLAHADLSGFSIFEEANYHGVRCAENALAALGYASRSLL
ncbi:MAG TPA: twin-arginine translocation pathway signal protein, partial [Rhodocyclaceae bacterium]|nr:twin-arginine translocation pathway signal protein [Rhodocyclaceae bacterium]